MSILSSTINEITYKDVISFISERNRESQVLDYKQDFSQKGSVAKTVSAFANSYGGTIIIGVVDDGDSYPEISNSNGIPHQEQNSERVTKSCLSNIDPIIIPQVHVAKDPGSDDEFVIIRVLPSLSAPHAFKFGEGKDKLRIYIRTNEDSHKFEREISNDNEYLNLLNKREKSIQLRENLTERASNRLNEWLRSEIDMIEEIIGINERQFSMPVMGISSGFSHDFICPIHFSSIPAFPNKPLCDLHQLLKFEGHKYSRVNRGQVRFYDHGSIRLHSDGLMGSRVIEGELYTFDLDEFGTCSLNGSFVERKDGTPYQNIVMSGSFIATCISFSLQFYSHINYEGPVLFRLHSSNLTEFNCSLLNKSAIEDHIELEYECYTHDLADRSNRLLIFDYFVKKFYRNYDFSPEMVDEIYQTEREFI